MAIQKKVSDPTEAALSAIEEALTSGFSAEAAKAASGKPDSPRLPDVDDVDIFANEIADVAKAKVAAGKDARSAGTPAREPAAKDVVAKEPAVKESPLSVKTDLDLPKPANSHAMSVEAPAPRSADNDDRLSVQALLGGLQARPSGMPLLWAGLASLLWLAGAYFYMSHPGGLFVTTDGAWKTLELPVMLASVVAIAVPVILFFMMAGVQRRSQEMRYAAQSMGAIAARLAEPESIASENIQTLGQAVRREVSSMGDGIERAISRAGELESLVHSEVSALERSYSENELKIRSLLNELAVQREHLAERQCRARPRGHALRTGRVDPPAHLHLHLAGQHGQ